MTGDELQRFINNLLADVFSLQTPDKDEEDRPDPAPMNGGMGMYSGTKEDMNKSTPTTLEEWLDVVLGPGDAPEVNDDVDDYGMGEDGLHFHSVTTAWVVNPTLRELSKFLLHLEEYGIDPDTKVSGTLWTEIQS